MTDVIKMDYELMEQMSRTFEAGAGQLEETTGEMRNLASTLQDGALLGRGGSAFVDAVEGKLVPAIQRLSAKYMELKRDIDGAVKDMKEADRKSRSLF